MLGNMWEWTSDWYKDSFYKESPGADPRGPKNWECRVLRGGSWNVNFSSLSRASVRFYTLPAARDNNIGFRCVGEISSLDSFLM